MKKFASVVRLERGHLGADPDHPVPQWAQAVLDAHNKSADAILELRSSRVFRTMDFITKDPVENSFPKTVQVNEAPIGIQVIRAQNMTDFSALFYDPPHVDWQPVMGGILVRYISGLNVSSRYIITLEAIYA